MINCQLSPTFFEEMDYRLPICTSGLDIKIHEMVYFELYVLKILCHFLYTWKVANNVKLELNEDSRFDMSRTSIMLRTAEVIDLQCWFIFLFFYT